MPSSVYLSFTSTQLKSTFFRIMVNRITFRNEAAQSIRVLACRDALPKGLIPKAKRLVQNGMSLRMNGRVLASRWLPGGWDVSSSLRLERECLAGTQQDGLFTRT